MSTIKVDTIKNTSNVEVFTAKAWVNFDGTTAGIRGSGNVSSIVDNGTGDYTVNFTTAMPDANFTAVSSGQLDSGANAANGNIITGAYRSATSHTTTSYRTSTVNSGGTLKDPVSYEIAIFR